MRRCATLLVLAVAAAALVSCNKSSGPSNRTDACGDIKSAVYGIINGVDYPEVVSLTPEQMKAIGFLSLDMSGGCSATAVAPNVVLAAAHCVEHVGPGGSVIFVVGENYMSPERTFTAREWHTHPDYPGSSGGYGTPMYDVSVIILDEDVTAYGIDPIPVNFEHFVLAGNVAQAVGYGITNPSGGWNTRRWWTAIPCVSEQSLWYTVDGGGVTGICQGDSGGPLLFEIPDRGLHVMGVVSSGEEGCVGATYYPRTDAPSITSWLLEYISMGPCGWEDLEGRCDGDTAIWCEDEAVWTHDCAEFGFVCGADDSGNMRRRDMGRALRGRDRRLVRGRSGHVPRLRRLRLLLRHEQRGPAPLRARLLPRRDGPRPLRRRLGHLVRGRLGALPRLRRLRLRVRHGRRGQLPLRASRRERVRSARPRRRVRGA